MNRGFRVVWNHYIGDFIKDLNFCYLREYINSSDLNCHSLDWHSILSPIEQAFIWNLKPDLYSYLVYYNYKAHIKSDANLYADVCSALVELHPLGMGLDAGIYKKHMKKYSTLLRHTITRIIDCVVGGETALWIFPAQTPTVILVLLSNIIKEKYSEAKIGVCNIFSQNELDEFISLDCFDYLFCGKSFTEKKAIKYLCDSFAPLRMSPSVYAWDEQSCRLKQCDRKEMPLQIAEQVRYIWEEEKGGRLYLSISNLSQIEDYLKLVNDINPDNPVSLTIKCELIDLRSILDRLLDNKKKYPHIKIKALHVCCVPIPEEIELMALLGVNSLYLGITLIDDLIKGNSQISFAQIVSIGKEVKRHTMQLVLLKTTEECYRKLSIFEKIEVKYRCHVLRHLPIILNEQISCLHKLSVSLSAYIEDREFEKMETYTGTSTYRFAQERNDGIGLVYEEFVDNICIRSILLDEVDLHILRKTKRGILSFTEIYASLEKEIEQSFLALRVMLILKRLQQQRLLYISEDYKEITSCINVDI